MNRHIALVSSILHPPGVGNKSALPALPGTRWVRGFIGVEFT